MLKVISCPGPEFKAELFQDFEGRGSAWVVSDLQSKWHLQKELLNRKGVLEQACLWRASELWRHLAFQRRPDTRVLSHELAQTLFWTWIEPMGLDWARSSRAVPVLLAHMKTWMGVFSDPRFTEVMPEWFRANPEAYVNFGHWFGLCHQIWNRCQEERYLMVDWLPAILLNEDLSALNWSRELIFDLGAQISPVEGQLIRELGRHVDVTVLYPEAPWIGLMRGTLGPYDEMLPQPDQGDANWQPPVVKQIQFGRFSTQLAEVKDAVARVRDWVESGVDPRQIAIVAPDIEAYWPALELYLSEEGLPCAKPLGARLGGFIEMARWLSSLRTAMTKVSAGDLEVHLFAGQTDPRLACHEFRVLFTNVYDAHDLKRAEYLFEAPVRPLGDAPLPLAKFLAWSLKFWSAKSPTERLRRLLQIAGQECPAGLRLGPAEWLSYVEGLLARRELEIRPGDEGGVWCVSLSSSDWLPVTHGIFLNATEGALRQMDTSPISAFEASQLLNDTGFAVGSADHQEQEFELLWFLTRHWTELHLNVSETDFSGRVLTPSKLWMWAGFVNDRLPRRAVSPLETRWDQIQRAPLTTIAEQRAFSRERVEHLAFALDRDHSGLGSSWKPLIGARISASSLSAYAECPFRYAASRVFKQVDDPVLDLDMDHRSRGSLLHALVEHLVDDPIRYDWSDEELRELVEQVRVETNVRSGDMRLWEAQAMKSVRLGRAFLEFEREWRERFPNTSTVGREVAFNCGWDLFSDQPIAADSAVTLSGKIDRVDRDHAHSLEHDGDHRYALIDYKASAANTKNWKSWLKNDEIQMALYALLIEQGLAGVPAGTVSAANYYIVKDRDRRKGFHLRDETTALYETAGHRNFINEQEKEVLFTELCNRIGDLVRKILSGTLNPSPKDTKICQDCNWRTQCRAPHLN